jgi:hypothetical protein
MVNSRKSSLACEHFFLASCFRFTQTLRFLQPVLNQTRSRKCIDRSIDAVCPERMRLARGKNCAA